MPTLPRTCPKAHSGQAAHCFTVIILDAGQGDATLLVYPDDSLVLVDCGSNQNRNVVGHEIEKVLDAYLARTGNRLKALVLTHPDQDHYNLVEALIVNKGVQVGTLFFAGTTGDYGDLGDWIRDNRDNPTTIDKVVALQNAYFSRSPEPELSFDGQGQAPDVDVRILSANVGDYRIKSDANPNSVVLLVTYLNINIFLMGDATTQTEGFIVNINKFRGDLTKLLAGRSTVLKAGHHGSNTSTGSAWLDLIEPKVVFISSDTQSFGGVSIPRSSVIDRILNKGTLRNFMSHRYVQYTDSRDRHEHVKTEAMVYTTLYYLNFKKKKKKNQKRPFVSYGTTWYYTITGDEKNGAFFRDDVYIDPSVGWDMIDTPF